MEDPTLADLVNKLVSKFNFKKKDAARTVYVMWKRGNLKLSESVPPSNLKNYVFHLENSWFWILTALVATTVAVAFVANSFPLLFFRFILGGILILVLPGAVLVAVLFPGIEDLDDIERLTWSLGLSIIIVPLVSLGLNYTPWGMTLTPMIVSLACLVQIVSVVAVVRKFHANYQDHS